MGTEDQSSDLDRDVDTSMRMFEKAKVGPAARISPIMPSKVLLVLDGSPQDETSVRAAQHFQSRFQSETLILDARDNMESDASDLAVDRCAAIPDSEPLRRGEGDSYDAILEAASHHAVDLLIVPCPFGRSFEKVGVDSAGTTIDVLLSRCPQSMLIIRRDDQQVSECTAQVSMVVGGECDVELRTAAWAFGLADQSASITLNLVIEKEQYENMRSILEALHPDERLDLEQFSEALAKAHKSIHDSMAKTANDLGMHYRLRPIAGEVAPPHPLQDSTKMLLVMPLEVDDRFEQGFVHDRIRRSPHPVLIVPGHVSESHTDP